MTCATKVIIQRIQREKMNRIRKILLDAAYTASTHQNVRQIYDLCNKNLHSDNPKRGNGQDQKNVSNTITNEDGFFNCSCLCTYCIIYVFRREQLLNKHILLNTVNKHKMHTVYQGKCEYSFNANIQNISEFLIYSAQKNVRFV